MKDGVWILTAVVVAGLVVAGAAGGKWLIAQPAYRNLTGTAHSEGCSHGCGCGHEEEVACPVSSPATDESCGGCGAHKSSETACPADCDKPCCSEAVEQSEAGACCEHGDHEEHAAPCCPAEKHEASEPAEVATEA